MRAINGLVWDWMVKEQVVKCEQQVMTDEQENGLGVGIIYTVL